jgi:tyrosyl-tRNA synthetase
VLGATEAFFFAGDPSKMSAQQFEEQFRNTERVRVSKADLKDIASLVVMTKLRPTKADVKRLVGQGGLSVNGLVVTSEEIVKTQLTEADFIYGKYIILKTGKKSFALVEIC